MNPFDIKLEYLQEKWIKEISEEVEDPKPLPGRILLPAKQTEEEVLDDFVNRPLTDFT